MRLSPFLKLNSIFWGLFLQKVVYPLYKLLPNAVSMSFILFFRTLIDEHRLPVYKPVVIVTQCLSIREVPYILFYHFMIVG